ncbi:MAG: hypothetical protein R3F29_02600 [Planctomycetota bacterium]
MTKHGHGLPRKRPGRSAKDDIASELPELEPLEELPTLEPVDDLPTLEPVEDEGPVKATWSASDDAEFDTELVLEVPDMPKKEVAGAVEAPLRRVAAAAAVRHRRVLVRFGGEALIGSAVKDLVVECLQDHKPLRCVVRRGFGDEPVIEGALPQVEMSIERQDGEVQVQVATADLAAEDLAIALEPHLGALGEAADGRRVVLQFRGGAKPDAKLRDDLAATLRKAGARRAAIGARVLFDRDIEDRVKVASSGSKFTVTISLTGDDAECIDALSLVLPSHAAAMDDCNVRFQFARESAAVQAFVVDLAKNAGATLIEVGGGDDFDIVWPPLVTVDQGREVTLKLTANGRSRAAVLAAFAREAVAHHAETHGKHVVVDWPQGFAVDAEAEQCLASVLDKLGARRLCCTVGGEDREPFAPLPLEMSQDGDRHVVRVDSEAGKPRELKRAVDRRLPAHLAALRGQSVRIEIAGEAAMSRSLVRELCTAIAEAGAMRLEVQEGGKVDVLLPPMLTVSEGASGLRIVAVPDGRDEAQQQLAIARELEGVELALANVTVAAGACADALVAVAMERGAAKVVLDGAAPMQLHPPLFESFAREGKVLKVVVEPSGDAAMDARMFERELPERVKSLTKLAGVAVEVTWPGVVWSAGEQGTPLAKLIAVLRDKQPTTIKLDAGQGAVQVHPEPKPEPAPAPAPVAAAPAPAAASTPAAAAPATPPPIPATPRAPGDALITLLGRRDEAIPPMVLLGVADGEDDGHLQAVSAELQSHLPRLRGRAVLLIPQAGGADVPVRKPTALVQMLGQVVPTGAAATLVFRGPDAQGRPHFQVLHSTLRAMPVGAVFADPRASR